MSDVEVHEKKQINVAHDDPWYIDEAARPQHQRECIWGVEEGDCEKARIRRMIWGKGVSEVWQAIAQTKWDVKQNIWGGSHARMQTAVGS